MSNKIFGSDIVDQSANVEVQKLQGEMKTLLEIFIQNSRAVELMRKALSNVDGYAAVTDAIKNTNRALDEQTKVKNQILALEKHLAVAKTEEYKKLMQLREERNKNNRELREEAKNALYATDAYKKLEAEYIAASRGAKALGAELGINDQRFKTAATNANALHDRLKAIDGSMGIHTRNVGNYTSATHSLSQVLREMPAFTYSAQTGLMGISNNLPILIDQFKSVKTQVGSTGGALKVFAGSLLSFPNIFTVVIGLFTIFYKEIMQFVTGTKEASEATKALYAAIGSETGKVEALTRQINNYNLTNEQRLKAAKDLKELYPTALKNYSAEEIAAGKAADAIMKIKTALVAVAMARAYQTDLEKKAAERYELEQKLALKKVELIKAESDEAAKLARAQSVWGTKNDEVATELYNKATARVSTIRNEIRDLESDAIGAELAMNSLAEKIGNMTSRASAGGVGLNGKDGYKKPKKDKDKTAPVVDIPDNFSDDEIADLRKYFDDIEKWIGKMYQEMINDPAIQKSLMSDLALKDGEQPLTDEEAAKLASDLMARIQQKIENNNQIKIKIRNLELDMQAVQLGADFLQSLNQMIYNAEIAQIERRDKKLQDSYDSRRQQIENSYSIQADRERELKKLEAERAAQQRSIDNQRRAAERRRAIGQKWTNVGEIIASTALAVIKAFTEGDPYTKSGRAGLAAAVGAVSLAKALAAPIPQYMEGTPKEGHKGGLAVIGDGGVPEYVEEPGKKGYWSKPFSQIVDLPAKTVVTPPEKLIEKLMMSTMASLGKMRAPVTTDSYQAQMLAEYESMTKELRETKKILERKNLSVNINGDLSHLLRMKELIS